jgi:hypothetical protein
MTKSLCTALLLLVGLAWAPTADSQVVARQGTPEVTEFHSPMILELPLPALVGLPIGSGKTLGAKLQSYSCEGVSVPVLLLNVSKRKPKQDPTLTIDVSGVLRVPPSHDRLVDLTFSILSNGKSLATAQIKRRDAEEDRDTSFRTSLLVNEQALRSAFTLDPPPTLQLTVAVAKDD